MYSNVLLYILIACLTHNFYVGLWGNCDSSCRASDLKGLEVACIQMPSCCPREMMRSNFTVRSGVEAIYAVSVRAPEDRVKVMGQIYMYPDNNSNKRRRMTSEEGGEPSEPAERSSFLARLKTSDVSALLQDPLVDSISCPDVTTAGVISPIYFVVATVKLVVSGISKSRLIDSPIEQLAMRGAVAGLLNITADDIHFLTIGGTDVRNNRRLEESLALELEVTAQRNYVSIPSFVGDLISKVRAGCKHATHICTQIAKSNHVALLILRRW